MGSHDLPFKNPHSLPPEVSNLTKIQRLKLITVNHHEIPSTANYNTWITLIYCPRDGSQTPHRKNPHDETVKKTDRTPFGVKSCFIEFSYHHRIQVPHLLPISQFACSYINLKCSFLLQVIHSITNSQKHS